MNNFEKICELSVARTNILHAKQSTDPAQSFRSFMDYHQANDLIFENMNDTELGIKILARI